MNANRRLQGRKQPERIMLCKLGGQESSSVLNFSEDGLCFESLTPIEETGLLQLRLWADLNNTIEATGRLAWIDSEKRTGGLCFLELSAPAREQIRAWLSENSTAVEETVARFCRSVIKQPDDQAAPDKPATNKPVIWQETRVRSTQLVPVERHRALKHRHFFFGVLIGFGIGTLALISIFRYAGGTKPGSPAWTAVRANRAARPSAEQTRSSAVQPASRSAPISEPAVEKVSVASPARPPQPAKPSESVASSRPSTKTEPLGASQAHSSSGQVEGKVQHPKKVSATPQQLWAALQAGNVKAAVALADLYARGEGVPVNCQQARILLQIASEKKNAEASRKLQELDKGGCPANSDSEPKP